MPFSFLYCNLGHDLDGERFFHMEIMTSFIIVRYSSQRLVLLFEALHVCSDRNALPESENKDAGIIYVTNYRKGGL